VDPQAPPASTDALPCVSSVGTARAARLADARLTLATSLRPATGDLLGFLHTVLAASVDVVRLRAAAEVPDGELAAAVHLARGPCDDHGALLLVDDRVAIALDAGADGVHVTRRGTPIDALRGRIGPDLLLSRSTQDVADLRASADEDVDHVTVPVRSASGRGDRWHLLRAATVRSPHLWSAVGGIGPSTIAPVLAAGARRVVVGAALTRAGDPAAVTWQLRRALGRFH
jgi:thiamine-phosphate pyrophosphorylase